MPTSRITITLPGDLVERIDQVAANRSSFLAAAAERELHRRLREGLRRSLDAPATESAELAEQGLTVYRDALEDDVADRVDPSGGVEVVWREDAGWLPGGEP